MRKILNFCREADSLVVDLKDVPESEKEIVTLLTNQRERFRRRNQELEQVGTDFQLSTKILQRLQKLVEENDKSKRDYEFIKTDFAALKRRMQQLESDYFFKDTKTTGRDPEKGLLNVIHMN